jgi:hypothetical protein
MHIVVLIIDHFHELLEMTGKQHVHIGPGADEIIGHVASNLVIISVDETKRDRAGDLAQKSWYHIPVVLVTGGADLFIPDNIGYDKHQPYIKGRQKEIENIKPVLSYTV